MLKLSVTRLCYPFLRTIISRNCTAGVQSDLVNSNVEKSALVKSLTEQFKNEELVQKVLNSHPEVQYVSITEWIRIVDKLAEFDFTVDDCLNMLAKYPRLLKVPPKQFEDTLGRWFDCNFGVEYFKFILMNCPYFLEINNNNIEKRIPHLRYLAPMSRDLLILLVQCPNVMYDDWNSILTKISYVTDTMRVEKVQLFRSLALSKSIEHIQLRHTLLERCGQYKLPSLYPYKKSVKKNKFINPHLKRITDNADISFSRKIARLTAEEYEAFQDLYEVEVQDAINDELFSDSEDES